MVELSFERVVHNAIYSLSLSASLRLDSLILVDFLTPPRRKWIRKEPLLAITGHVCRAVDRVFIASDRAESGRRKEEGARNTERIDSRSHWSGGSRASRP